MTEIHIRPARLDELATLISFEQGIVAAERPFDPTLKAGEIHYYDIGALIESPEAQVVVAVAGDELVGSGYIRREVSKNFRTHDFHGYIGFMYVKPTYRGQGISKLVLDALIAWGHAHDLQEFQLEVYADNEAAVRAYTKAGFSSHLVRMRLESRTNNL